MPAQTCDVKECTDNADGIYVVENPGDDRELQQYLCDEHYHYWRGSIVEEIEPAVCGECGKSELQGHHDGCSASA